MSIISDGGVALITCYITAARTRARTARMASMDLLSRCVCVYCWTGSLPLCLPVEPVMVVVWVGMFSLHLLLLLLCSDWRAAAYGSWSRLLSLPAHGVRQTTEKAGQGRNRTGSTFLWLDWGWGWKKTAWHAAAGHGRGGREGDSIWLRGSPAQSLLVPLSVLPSPCPWLLGLVPCLCSSCMSPALSLPLSLSPLLLLSMPSCSIYSSPCLLILPCFHLPSFTCLSSHLIFCLMSAHFVCLCFLI